MMEETFEEKLDWLFDDYFDNRPLYRDSGLWQLRSDDMEEVLIQQENNESFLDFIKRCKNYLGSERIS